MSAVENSAIVGWHDDPAVRQHIYEQDLVRRYVTGLPLTTRDKRDARRLIRTNGGAA